MKDIIATLLIMLACITALAQQHASEDTIMLQKAKVKFLKPAKQKQKATKYTYAADFVSPVSVQILTGSQGIGADVKYGFLPKLSGRLGFGIIPVDASRGFGFSSFPVEGQLSTRFSNLHLLADYAPFNTQGFRIVGGAAYLIHGNANRQSVAYTRSNWCNNCPGNMERCCTIPGFCPVQKLSCQAF